MLVFSKGAFFVEVNIGQEKSPDKVTLQVANKGNVDARLLPRPADARPHGAGLYSVFHYATGADLAGAAEFCRAELTRLRRENRLLQQEKEILKKAAAWFAKETL